MAFPRVLAISLAVFAFNPSALLGAGEPADRRTVSRHTSDAILAGFRRGEAAAPASDTASAPITAVAPPADVEPDVVVLPKFTVVGKGAAKLDRDVVTPKTESIPLTLGTGITEFKGKKFTVLIRRILFIPIAFKIEW